MYAIGLSELLGGPPFAISKYAPHSRCLTEALVNTVRCRATQFPVAATNNGAPSSDEMRSVEMMRTLPNSQFTPPDTTQLEGRVVYIRASTSLNVFKRKLKTHLFTEFSVINIVTF